jgi:serine acetyltransferase
MSVRRALKQDAQFYRRLRYGERSHALFAWTVWISSTGLFVLAMHRASHTFHKWRQQKQHPIKRRCLHLLLKCLSPLLVFRAKSEITGATEVEPGVYLSDRGELVIGARAIGEGSVIHHGVTIGMSTMNHGTPAIGRNVWIGPDCVIYGNIEIGDGATLLPGTVLSKSIPARVVVKGNPGRIVEMSFDNSRLRSSLDYRIDFEAVRAP